MVSCQEYEYQCLTSEHPREVCNLNVEAHNSSISQKEYETENPLKGHINEEIVSSITDYFNLVKTSIIFLFEASKTNSICKQTFCQILHKILKSSNDLRMNLSLSDEQSFRLSKHEALNKMMNKNTIQSFTSNPQTSIDEISFHTFIQQAFEPNLMICQDDHLEPLMLIEGLNSDNNHNIESPLNYSNPKSQSIFDSSKALQYNAVEEGGDDFISRRNGYSMELKSLNFTPLKSLDGQPRVLAESENRESFVNPTNTISKGQNSES
jgi:hypothetical protein